MDAPRLVVISSVTLILVLTLLTGPGTGLIQVPEDSPFGGSVGINGTASIGAVEFPDAPTLRQGASDQYVLRVGDATVPIESVTGTPGLVYRLDIRYLWYSRTSLTILDAETTGPLTVQLPKATLAAESVVRESYPAEFRVLLRSGEDVRTVARTNVTVTVGQ